MKKLAVKYKIWGLTLALLIAFQISGAYSQNGYKLNREKIYGLVMVGVGGFMDGAVERFEFRGRTVFENRWGADPYGFFGSRSWERLYTHPNFWNKNFGVFDFYHVADDMRKVGYIGGGIVIGIGGGKRRQKFTHYLIDVGLSMVVSGGMKYLGDRVMDNL